MKRREFLKHVTRTTAALSATALSFRRMASANERVRVALIGCGGRGTHVAKLMAQVPGVQLVAACDVYDSNAEKACQWMSPEARPYKDFRKVLEREADWLPPWHALLRVFRRLEAQGKIRGGRFVAGMSGEQYALPEAVSSMRSIRRQEAKGLSEEVGIPFFAKMLESADRDNPVHRLVKFFPALQPHFRSIAKIGLSSISAFACSATAVSVVHLRGSMILRDGSGTSLRSAPLR